MAKKHLAIIVKKFYAFRKVYILQFKTFNP